LKLIRKLRIIPRKKVIPCLAALILVALLACIALAPPQQFIIGATRASWTIYATDVDQVRYLPGTGTPAGSQQPSAPSDANPNTFAFKIITDAVRVSAVSIKLTSAVDNANFSKFDVRVQWWDATDSAWKYETLYTSDTGSTTESFIDGLTKPVDVGYVHHAASTTKYYLIEVTYCVDTPTSITMTFQYTLQTRPSLYFLLGIASPALIISVWLLYPRSKSREEFEEHALRLPKDSGARDSNLPPPSKYVLVIQKPNTSTYSLYTITF